ncbi:glucokinase [Natronospira bacteriovora]|uniref:Glucokinase n=1 Tax=Natronospira bacteriovora TaxID=3069753 RepID=A0ABU0W6F1_9GAMM|nr:glucokinase [Natronospira sp. AB-CW4]MDQ2069040.1 glucokinase [Natronospira sp. AB-CW4]
MQILIGDIGGTRVRLRLLDSTPDGWQLRHESIRRSREFESLEDALRCFLEELSRAERANVGEAWLAVAGPVSSGRVQFTNLPWESEEHYLETALQLPRVHLVNDLEALAHALPHIPDRQMLPIQEGHAGRGPRLLISVGTGLGVASLLAESKEIRVLPSEGGHIDFASQTPEQHALWEALSEQYGHVSYERLLSGPGLVKIYRFKCQLQSCRPFDGHALTEDPVPLICQRAENVEDKAAVATIRCFTEILGAFAGNAALFNLATGGVYLAGGLLARLHPYLDHHRFTQAFHRKGRLQPLMETIPITALATAEPGLEGISRLASRQHHAGTGRRAGGQEMPSENGVHAGAYYQRR